MTKKIIKIESDKFNLTLARVVLSVLADNGAIEMVLAELIRLNVNGSIIFDFNGLNDTAKRLDINYQTFRTCLNRLVERGVIKREGHAIYLHPMLTGTFTSIELISQ